MKNLISTLASLSCFFFFFLTSAQQIPQGIGIANNMTFKKIQDSTFKFEFKLLRTDNRPDTLLGDTSINWFYQLNTKIGYMAFELVGWNTIGDTFRKLIPTMGANFKIFKGNPKLKQMADFPHLLPSDSVVITGLEISVTDTLTLPHHGIWTFEVLGIPNATTMSYANYCLRYRGVTNLSDSNYNPNIYYVPGSVIITNTNTVVGMVTFNSNTNSHGVTYESDSWIQCENGKQISHSLGFYNLDSDSLVITRVNTITSDISPIPSPVWWGYYDYLYGSTKVVPFVSPYNMNNPFETGNTFWFDQLNQTITFKVPLGTPQQAAVLTFKVDEYDHITGAWKGTTYRDIFIVSNDPPATPNGIPDLDKNQILVYPNPVRDWLGIKDYSGPVEIYNLMGQKIFEIKNFSGKIDVRNLTKGIYIIKIKNRAAKFAVE